MTFQLTCLYFMQVSHWARTYSLHSGGCYPSGSHKGDTTMAWGDSLGYYQSEVLIHSVELIT